MIDTVRLIIPLTKSLKDAIEQRAVEVSKFDHSAGTLLFSVHKTEVYLPSYDSSVNLFLPPNASELILEFSLAKYVYSHNIYLLYLEDIQLSLTALYLDLLREFPGLPDLTTWRIARFDLCYTWKLPTEAHLLSLLQIVQKIDYPRQRKQIYDTSVTWVGSSYSSKFYLKSPEFQRHDYQRIKKRDPDMANMLLNTANNCLRFEVTMRKKYILDYFQRDTIDILYNPYSLTKLLQEKFARFQGFLGKITMTNPSQALDQLLTFYKPTKAIQLYQFWLAWYQSGSSHKEILRANYHRTTIYRHLKDLRIAGVGVYVPDLQLPTLEIPSPLAVN